MQLSHLSYDAERLQAVCARLALRLAVLFGSRATGMPSPSAGSDLDVAVLGEIGAPAGALLSYLRELAPVFGEHSLDLVLLDTADPLLRWEVMRSGVLLCGDPDVFLEYRAFAHRDFVDSADLRELEGALFRKKMDHLRQELNAPP
jgi:predicted nucleotidyltransferase